VKITKIHLALPFTDRCKQATSYHKGRILLAGDAVHIHGPSGGQGPSLGLGDVLNLGWKLAATVRRESGPNAAPVDVALLDTYESEGVAHAHPLVGCSSPDFELHNGSRLGPKLNEGR
jgi:2-polyprenyl-6-methoxyphenol hydroxylase-like FAD-dependent oxidoreductase